MKPDGQTVLHLLHNRSAKSILPDKALKHLSCRGQHPSNLEKLYIIKILKAGKPREQGHFYCPISLLCHGADSRAAAQRLLLSIVEALGTRPSQHGFNLRLSTTAALLPISPSVITSFNERKSPSRMIVITVDINKAFNTVTQRLFFI